jgi:hypothetical protein
MWQAWFCTLETTVGEPFPQIPVCVVRESFLVVLVCSNSDWMKHNHPNWVVNFDPSQFLTFA